VPIDTLRVSTQLADGLLAREQLEDGPADGFAERLGYLDIIG